LSDLAEAERRYKAALARDPGHFGAVFYVGLLKYRQGKTAKAITYLEKANTPSLNCNVLDLLIEWYREVRDMEKAHQSETQFAKNCR
jgi:tetratricopeptide (TPR) repeat protein